jgi:hypothetical protein
VIKLKSHQNPFVISTNFYSAIWGQYSQIFQVHLLSYPMRKIYEIMGKFTDTCDLYVLKKSEKNVSKLDNLDAW